MNTLLTVLKSMLEILGMQQAQIKALMTEVELDNQSDFTDADFADLGARIAALNVGSYCTAKLRKSELP